MEVHLKSTSSKMDYFTLHARKEQRGEVYTNGDLEVKVYWDEALTVETEFLSRANFFDLPTRPRDFAVFFDGTRRGHLHRSWSYPFAPDVLTLDEQEYPLPGFGRHHIRRLGLRLHRDFWNGKPFMVIEKRQHFAAGLLALAWYWVKWLYTQ